MSKEKNKNTFRVAALLLVACLISSVMLSGTFAKYTSEFAGEDTALVAKWNLTMSDGTNLYDTAKLNNPTTLDLFTHAYNDNILSTAGTQKIIAPGVSGNFVLDLTNNSDVAADIEFAITKPNPETDAAVPMEFSIGKDFHDVGATILQGHAALQEALNNLNTAPESDGLIRLAAVEVDEEEEEEIVDSETITVYWRWPFGTSDLVDHETNVADTTLGTTSADAAALHDGQRTSYTLNIAITATQVAPGTTTPPAGD